MNVGPFSLDMKMIKLGLLNYKISKFLREERFKYYAYILSQNHRYHMLFDIK